MKKKTAKKKKATTPDPRRIAIDMSRLARLDREARAARWTGRMIREGSFGEMPEAGGTDPREFFARKDNGSV